MVIMVKRIKGEVEQRLEKLKDETTKIAVKQIAIVEMIIGSVFTSPPMIISASVTAGGTIGYSVARYSLSKTSVSQRPSVVSVARGNQGSSSAVGGSMSTSISPFRMWTAR